MLATAMASRGEIIMAPANQWRNGWRKQPKAAMATCGVIKRKNNENVAICKAAAKANIISSQPA
jgi:hypothetical protein